MRHQIGVGRKIPSPVIKLGSCSADCRPMSGKALPFRRRSKSSAAPPPIGLYGFRLCILWSEGLLLVEHRIHRREPQSTQTRTRDGTDKLPVFFFSWFVVTKIIRADATHVLRRGLHQSRRLRRLSYSAFIIRNAMDTSKGSVRSQMFVENRPKRCCQAPLGAA
mgnify:CR=1 FL=1